MSYRLKFQHQGQQTTAADNVSKEKLSTNSRPTYQDLPST